MVVVARVALLASFNLLGTGLNLLFAVLGVAFVGAALGIPAGMAIGTIPDRSGIVASLGGEPRENPCCKPVFPVTG